MAAPCDFPGCAARLMTIPGVDMVVALAMKAAIGEVTRFD